MLYLIRTFKKYYIMKKLLIPLAIILSSVAYSQNFDDAVIFNQESVMGDARYVGMAGSFGALGGNITAVKTNPAGLGVFRKNSCEISFGSINNLNETFYIDERNKRRSNLFTFNNVGFNTAYETGKNDLNVKFVNFSASMNKDHIYNSAYVFEAYNNRNSVTDDFLATNYNLAWDAGLLFTDSISPDVQTDYRRVNDLGELETFYGGNQRFHIERDGQKNNFNFAVGANVGDKFYVGGSVNLSSIKYESKVTVTETDIDNTRIDLYEFLFDDYYKSSGKGLGVSLGVIGKPVEFIRVGAAYHTPMVYAMTDYTYSGIDTYFDFDSGLDDLGYEEESEFDYTYTTPAKFIGSLALTLKNYASLNVDYQYSDYSASYFSADNYDFVTENKLITDNLQGVQTIRVGGELWAGAVGFRAGVSSMTNPYSQQEWYTSNINTAGLGLGIRDEVFYLDLAYSLTSYSEDVYLYSDINGNAQSAENKHTSNQLSGTVGWRF